MANVLKVKCGVCGSRCFIRRSDFLSDGFARIYITCQNPQCCQTEVYNFERSHVVKSSKLSKDRLLENVISLLSEQDKQHLKKMLEAV
ncbi:ogr/Delta-like zinc finger family protein [Seminibacterium arietis]|uniref:Ogr/Delta-like zinc finger family protein n=1 Tax=Seminibacterium arietis TaxID=1173502 RepID=A0ABW3I7K9_9PAST